MAVTFRVDEVVRARDALPTRRLCEVLAGSLAVGGDPDLPVVAHGPTHPLLGAVHLAFAQHRPLVLSPDAVWLTIAQGVAQHVRLHAEALRPRLVRHADRKTLRVEWDGPVPRDVASWQQIVGRFRDAVADEVGDGRARLFECDFSTTTDVERVASQVVLMDVYAPYFDYRLVTICGIPEVTLLGTVDDWRALRARLDVIAELELGWWMSSLAPIADQFVLAARGAPDVSFWRRIYSPRDAYGGDVITGWVTRLYPYLLDGGRVTARNPMLELPLDEPRGHDPGTGAYDGPGLAAAVIPAGPSTATVIVEDRDGKRSGQVALDGGVLAVAQDADGRLTPICGWALRHAPPAMASVVDRIVAEHQATPAPARDWRARLRVQGPADVVALYDRLDGAVMFAEREPWRVRALAEQEAVEVELPGGRTYSIQRLIDLPDGTFVALADTRPAVYVRGRVDALEPVPPAPAELADYVAEGLVMITPRRASRERAVDLDVVATSLAELLSRALDADGDVELPARGKLIDHIPERILG